MAIDNYTKARDKLTFREDLTEESEEDLDSEDSSLEEDEGE